MASVVNCANRNLITKIILRPKAACCRWVTTAGMRQKEEVAVGPDKVKCAPIPDFTKPLDKKNWVSYGFDYDNAEVDKYKMHSGFFLMLLCVVAFSFLNFYGPDQGHKHWARREAYIRLHEREKLGLDPIDKNYVDPEKMVLPSDEELGDFEIVL